MEIVEDNHEACEDGNLARYDGVLFQKILPRRHKASVSDIGYASISNNGLW